MTSRCAAYDARIRRLVAEGMSSTQIAAEIGHGLTKGMIVGYRDRNHIHSIRHHGGEFKNGKTRMPVPSVQPEPKRERGTAFHPAAWHASMPSWAAAGPAPRTCRYPIGDPAKRGFHFCEQPIERGSYCARHWRVCYQRVNRRQIQVLPPTVE